MSKSQSVSLRVNNETVNVQVLFKRTTEPTPRLNPPQRTSDITDCGGGDCRRVASVAFSLSRTDARPKEQLLTNMQYYLHATSSCGCIHTRDRRQFNWQDCQSEMYLCRAIIHAVIGCSEAGLSFTFTDLIADYKLESGCLQLKWLTLIWRNKQTVVCAVYFECAIRSHAKRKRDRSFIRW